MYIDWQFECVKCVCRVSVNLSVMSVYVGWVRNLSALSVYIFYVTI